MAGISTFLSGGIFSVLVVLWTIISIVLLAFLYRVSSRSNLLIIGTLLGSIIFVFGAYGFFSGLLRTVRVAQSLSTLDIANMLILANREARVPFSIGTIFTIIYFIILSIVVVLKKTPFKKWALWVGFTIFVLFVPLNSYLRYSMNLKLLKGFGKIVTTLNQVPRALYPFVKTGRMVVLTSILLTIVYLLVAVLLTIHKKAKPKNPE